MKLGIASFQAGCLARLMSLVTTQPYALLAFVVAWLLGEQNAPGLVTSGCRRKDVIMCCMSALLLRHKGDGEGEGKLTTTAAGPLWRSLANPKKLSKNLTPSTADAT